MFKYFKFVIVLLIILLFNFVVFAEDSWIPEKTVVFYVDHGAGGGSDIFTRTVVSIIQEEEMLTSLIRVINKPGTAVGALYTKRQKGNPYLLMNFNAGFLNQMFLSDADFSYSEFTPLPRMCIDPNIFIVTKDSQFNTMYDLVEYARKYPKEVSIGITKFGNSEHTFVEEIRIKEKIEVNIIPFKSGAEVMAALLGGHIDTTPANVSEAIGQLEAGAIRALAINTEERISELPEVPTLSELGIEALYMQFRGFLLPPDVPKEAQMFWERTLKMVTETEQWKEYIGKNLMKTEFIPAEEHAKIINDHVVVLEENLRKIGMLED
jgi:putative tricarboxylic transport membrane protein